MTQPFNFKDHWSAVTLGNLSLDIRYGLTISTQNTGSHRLIRITDITDEGELKDFETKPQHDFSKCLSFQDLSSFLL
jgi:hypothetical protein